jgi:diguanylate cyclase (GGDEF)-like protein/PAS domain S-box-containing protein
MDTKGRPKRDLADELESLREEIAHLQSLIQAPVKQPAPPEASGGAAAAEAAAFPPRYIENGPLGMALVTPRFQIEKANGAFCRMLDYTPDEARSLDIERIAQDSNNCRQLLQQIFEKVQPVSKTETQFLKKTGESFWVQFTASTIPEEQDGSKYCLLIIEDIGDRIGAERTLQTEKRLLESLINSSLDGIVAFDSDGFFTVWNPAMERIFGISAKDTLGRLAFQACPFLVEIGEDVNFTAALKGKKVISREKSYTIPGSTTTAYFEGYYGPMYSPVDGKVIGGLAIIRDVTERTLAEEEKRISEQRYRELFENAYDMVYTFDLSGQITSINKAAERILGYTRAEALKMRFHQFVAPEFQQIARRMLDRQIADQAPATQELEVIAKDSSRFTLEVSNRLVFREGKAIGVQGIARDITERKKTEAALQSANVNLEAWVQELEQRTREMTLLSEMGDILRACLTTEEVYEVIVRISQEIFPVQGGALYVIGPLRNIVEEVAQWGEKTGAKSTFTPDECWALRRGRVHWVEDTSVGLLCKHLSSPPPRGYLCVPMMAQGEAVGVLHLTQPENARMPEAKQRLAMAMAEHVAMALSNLRLHETLRNQSIRDSLTGLFNRSFMEESLELELRRSSRSQSPLSLIMLSLDNFQTINENYGADVGDSLLRRTGMLLQSNVRQGDIASRFGGYTYVLILPHSSYEVGRQRAQTICDLTRTLEIKHQGEQAGHVTASVGLAVFPEHGQTVENLLSSAEAALNRARSSGGDCVVVAA